MSAGSFGVDPNTTFIGIGDRDGSDGPPFLLLLLLFKIKNKRFSYKAKARFRLYLSNPHWWEFLFYTSLFPPK